MRVVIVLAALAVAGCGADGEPIRPEAKTTLSIGADGVSVSTGVAVRQGPVAVGVSF